MSVFNASLWTDRAIVSVDSGASAPGRQLANVSKLIVLPGLGSAVLAYRGSAAAGLAAARVALIADGASDLDRLLSAMQADAAHAATAAGVELSAVWWCDRRVRVVGFVSALKGGHWSTQPIPARYCSDWDAAALGPVRLETVAEHRTAVWAQIGTYPPWTGTSGRPVVAEIKRGAVQLHIG